MRTRLYHFSEDPSIKLFRPHVPATNPGEAPAVWAIDHDHAPLYWFPRDCPRVAIWAGTRREREAFGTAFSTSAARIQAIELGWLDRMRGTELHRYEFEASAFVRRDDAAGYWVSDTPVRPTDVTPMGDLLDAHRRAGVELRLVPSLWPLIDSATDGPWSFSIVRKASAMPRP